MLAQTILAQAMLARAEPATDPPPSPPMGPLGAPATDPPPSHSLVPRAPRARSLIYGWNGANLSNDALKQRKNIVQYGIV
eukprot:4488209-Heterocapsa_arctica.AAC.1